MRFEEILEDFEATLEGVTTVFGKSGNKVVRKYRCTSGTRKGRIVSKPSTCTAPKNVKASVTMKKTRRKKGNTVQVRAQRTKKTNPASQKLRNLNVGRRRIKPRKRRGAGKRL
jgi:hypothetical protein